MKIIDAHSHLWLRQDTVVDGQRIYPLGRGRAMFFGEERQMLPPFMTDGSNTAEVFRAVAMDYFKSLEASGVILSICLADDASQIRLARARNVYVEPSASPDTTHNQSAPR